MKKRIAVLLLLSASCVLTACGGGSDDKRTVVNFYGWGDESEQANFQTMINKFMELNPDIKVTYEADVEGTYNRNLKNKAKNLPDVFYVPDYDFYAWADGGKLLDLSEYVSQEEINSVWEESITMYRYDRSSGKLGTGALYGLPKDLGPYSLVFNKNMLNDAIAKAKDDGKEIAYPSFTTPMTWDEFSNYLVTLKPYLVSNKNPNGYGVSSYELMDAVWSNNADFWTEDTRTSRITEKNFTDAVQWIADLSLVHHVMPTPKEQEAENGYKRFLNKGVLFTFMGPWDEKAYWNGPDFDYDIIPTPVGNASGSVSTSWVGSVAFAVKGDLKKGDKAKLDASVKLAKWLTFSQDVNKMNVELGQAMPNLVSMAENEFVNNTFVSGRHALPEHKQVWIDMVKQTNNIKHKHRAKYYLYEGQCFDDLCAELYDVYHGDITAAEWAKNYNKTFQEGLDRSHI